MSYTFMSAKQQEGRGRVDSTAACQTLHQVGLVAAAHFPGRGILAHARFRAPAVPHNDAPTNRTEIFHHNRGKLGHLAELHGRRKQGRRERVDV